MEPKKKKNWKTTIAAIAGAVGLIAAGIAALLDGDPTTSADTTGIIQAVGVILAALGFGGAGILSRDASNEPGE